MITAKALCRLLQQAATRHPDEKEAEDRILSLALEARQAARLCDISLIKRNMQLAERFYEEGDPVVKRLIERIYMPALNNILLRNCTAGRMLKIYMPLALFRLHIRQVYR